MCYEVCPKDRGAVCQSSPSSCNNYWAGHNTIAECFTESGYLTANPDVAAAVRPGGFSSGMQHYIRYGRGEGRNGCPNISCSPSAGSQCTASNACGQNTGTYQCSGACSARAPALPGNYGQSCAGGLGTIGCDGACACTQHYYCVGNDQYLANSSCTGTFQQTCAFGFSAGSCITAPPPVGSLPGGIPLKLTPSLVHRGNTTRVTWSVDNVSSCHVSGNGDAWDGATGNHPSSAVNAQSTYSFTCNGLDGSVLTGNATVNIIPNFQERFDSRAIFLYIVRTSSFLRQAWACRQAGVFN